MYPISNPQLQLDLYHQNARELYDAAAERHLAREAGRGRHRRSFRRSRAGDRHRLDGVPAAL
jgi:hypothetical protein